MEIVNFIADAVAEYDNAADRPETPNWITVDQLAYWLENSNKLSRVDVYSVIAKTLGFIVHYCTPQIHRGGGPRDLPRVRGNWRIPQRDFYLKRLLLLAKGRQRRENRRKDDGHPPPN